MANQKNTGYIEADKNGQLILPPDTASKYGIKPGDRIRFTENQNGLNLQLPMRLSKLYIEPTNLCNIQCTTCIRNTWDEPMGRMSDTIFERIVDGICSLPSLPENVFFGGFGEPLSHPGIIDMISRIKNLGISVELITNATLLDRNMAISLMRTGLDTLWVSLDGATPESYTDVRLGAELPNVLKNLENLNKINYDIEELYKGDYVPLTRIRLGIVFVAMRSNIKDLPAVIDTGKRLGTERFLVTNVLPYTKEMIDEALYYRSLNNGGFGHLYLPIMDMDDITRDSIYKAMLDIYGTWPGSNPENKKNFCPFIQNGAGAISWDGNLSPCLPLMHNHTSYLRFLEFENRNSRKWLVGNILDRSLAELWNLKEHREFRERVMSFDFSPCITCSGCDLSESNEKDCINNIFPTCGSCLWAQGVIQCP
jgi:MoaA/NifB/PqqE/SkfB family radical SAM enzyme